jgi:hypothetical protein
MDEEDIEQQNKRKEQQKALDEARKIASQKGPLSMSKNFFEFNNLINFIFFLSWFKKEIKHY